MVRTVTKDQSLLLEISIVLKVTKCIHKNILAALSKNFRLLAAFCFMGARVEKARELHKRMIHGEKESSKAILERNLHSYSPLRCTFK